MTAVLDAPPETKREDDHDDVIHLVIEKDDPLTLCGLSTEGQNYLGGIFDGRPICPRCYWAAKNIYGVEQVERIILNNG